MDFTEGSSCMSDSDGNILLYTSGRNVYNRCHQVMLNGSGMAGHSSSLFGALIVPNPADGNQYYIFANDGHPTGGGTGLFHSLVDVTLDTGNGAVLAAGKNTPLVADTSELLQGAYHPNGTDFWAVVVDEPSQTGGVMQIYAYHISATGVSAPVISTMPGAIIDSTYDPSWFKISPDSQKAVLWVGSWTANERKQLLLDFNNTTGAFTYNNSFGVLNTTTNNATDQDTRKGGFSPDSQFYYAARYVTPYVGAFPRDLVQYPIAGLNPATVPTIIQANTGLVDDIRVGPDNRAYVQLTDDNLALSRINSPNLAGVACDFQRGIIPLGGRGATATLPNTFLMPNIIIPTITPTIAISSNPNPITICAGESVLFTATITNPVIPNYQWQIDGVDVAGEINPTFTTTALTNGQVVTCVTLDGCIVINSNAVTATVSACTSTSIDFDGVNDYANRAPLLGGNASISMMSWIKLDTGFSGGDIMGQGNYRLYVDASDRLTTQINEAGASTAITYQLNMQDTAGDGWTYTGVTGDLSIYANGVHVIGSPFTLLADMSNATTETFTANVGDLITMDFLSDDYPTEMSFNIVNMSETGTPQVYPAVGDHGHPGGGQTNENINPGFTASCGACTGPVTSHTTPVGSAPTLTEDLWCHVASIYDGAAGTMKLYINGELQDTRTGVAALLDTNSDDFEIGRKSDTQTNHFDGAIYETRVYNVALTEIQLREQIYQEIQDNGGNVHGSIVPKDIDGGSLSWSNLIMYYKMANVAAGTTTDDSVVGADATLNFMTTTQNRTAPLPYVANAGGNWTTAGTWQNGTEWDITSLPNKDWAIVQVTNSSKVTTTATHSHLGLLVDAGSELEIQGDQLLTNTSYLKIDGQLDLAGESQLVQTVNSDLDVMSAGYLEIDQQGKGSRFRYNYWSSPVSPINATANNTDYSVADVLYDGTDANNPVPVQFTTNWDGAAGAPITIADYWIFKFVNQNYVYANWFLGHIRSTGKMRVGEGYTQKGVGAVGAPDQNYVFVGKPNNGVISHPISSNNTSVLGNPYPSALDAHQFITDNISDLQNNGIGVPGATNGTLYFWEHWGGDNHFMSDTQGGYATLNLLGSTLAMSDPMVAQIGGGSVLPERYIPVGQGFYLQGSPAGGTIEFNNGQRVFEKEGAASVFIREGDVLANKSAVDDISRIYFRFITPEGHDRQFLLGTKPGLPSGINYGYDGRSLGEQPNDCSFLEGNIPLIIQGIPEIYSGLELPLEIRIEDSGVCKLKTESLLELDPSLEVFLYDSELGVYTQISESLEATFELAAGTYSNRFYIVFRESAVLDVYEEEIMNHGLLVFYSGTNKSVVIKNTSLFDLDSIVVYNQLGQIVYNHTKNYNDVTKVSLPINVSTGVYLVQFKLNNNQLVTKKLLVE